MQENSGVSFPFFFEVLQTMGTKHFSADAVVRELADLRSKVPRDMSSYLMELWSLNTLLHSRAPEHLRFSKITDSYRNDVHTMLGTHFPHLASIIKDKDKELYMAYATELKYVKEAGGDESAMTNTYHPFASLTTIVLTHTSAEEVAEVFKGRYQGRKMGHSNAIAAMTGTAQKAAKPKGNQKPKQAKYTDASSMAVQVGGRRRDNQPSTRGARQGPTRGGNSGRYQTSRPERKFGDVPEQYRNKNEHSAFPRSKNMTNPDSGKQGRNNDSNLACSNCAKIGHKWRVCKKYGGANPGSRECNRCGGKHVAACVDKGRPSNGQGTRA
jgi:hypothetical protein